MSRLLHAAARGARIQYMYQIDQEKGWIPAVIVRTDNIYKYRIHPADVHLAYGPISTELRKMAADDSWKPGSYRVLAVTAANEFQVYFDGSRENYPLFYLILAEFLADEGM